MQDTIDITTRGVEKLLKVLETMHAKQLTQIVSALV